MDLAETRGMLFDDLIDRMSSRTYTLERARAIITKAAETLNKAR